MLIPVVPPPKSTTTPSFIPRTYEAAVGSSTTLTTSIPADSTTLTIALTLPGSTPGGIAVYPFVISMPSFSSRL